MNCPTCGNQGPEKLGDRFACGGLEGSLCFFAFTAQNFKRPAILTEREKTHGPFQMTACTAQEIKAQFHTLANYKFKSLSYRQREALDMIASKIARILSGNPNHKDTWIDIAGYANLGAEACDE